MQRFDFFESVVQKVCFWYRILMLCIKIQLFGTILCTALINLCHSIYSLCANLIYSVLERTTLWTRFCFLLSTQITRYELCIAMFWENIFCIEKLFWMIIIFVLFILKNIKVLLFKLNFNSFFFCFENNTYEWKSFIRFDLVSIFFLCFYYIL